MKHIELWKSRLSRCRAAYADALLAMDERERLYRGARELTTFVGGVKATAPAYHVRNIVAENIESMVDAAIPQPKVTARRAEDEWRAVLIERMLRNELDRLRGEELNDMQERTVPIQGGGFWLIEWDSDAVTHAGSGEVALSVLHPKQFLPQDGVTTGIEDMDYFILAFPQTRETLRRRYGVHLPDALEEDPGLRQISGDADAAEDLLTQYVAYYKNVEGGIGVFSWCDDTVLYDFPDYQSRRRRACVQCGASDALAESDGEEAPACHFCGGTRWQEEAADWEEIWLPIRTRHGREITGAKWVLLDGEQVLRPTRIPRYRPGLYPVVLQKNISLYGSLLGDSDAEKISDFQNAINWLNQKIDRKLMEAGTLITGPANSAFDIDPRDHRILRLESAADKALIDTYEFSGDVSQEFAQLSQCYEAARQVLGITDSFQGRRDETATSGRAKEFAASQSAGRMESRRRMKEAAWSRIFELIFRFRLAYTDEPRPVVAKDAPKEERYDDFDRYDFLEWDEVSGTYWWNDGFLFSCDEREPLTENRERLWEEARLNFTSGAYGDIKDPETLTRFWTEMERLHYPLAGEVKQSFRAAEAPCETQKAF